MIRDLFASLLLIHVSSLYMMNLSWLCDLLDMESEYAHLLGLALVLLGNMSLNRPWLVPLLLPLYLVLYAWWFHQWATDYLWWFVSRGWQWIRYIIWVYDCRLWVLLCNCWCSIHNSFFHMYRIYIPNYCAWRATLCVTQCCVLAKITRHVYLLANFERAPLTEKKHFI